MPDASTPQSFRFPVILYHLKRKNVEKKDKEKLHHLSLPFHRIGKLWSVFNKRVN